jgi:hypothetical protein
MRVPVVRSAVEFDIPVARQEVSVGVHQTCPITPFSSCAGALVRGVDIGHVTPPKRLHHFSDAVRLVRRHEHVHVIGHQHIGVHRSGVSRRGLLETFQVEAIIVLMEKD